MGSIRPRHKVLVESGVLLGHDAGGGMPGFLDLGAESAAVGDRNPCARATVFVGGEVYAAPHGAMYVID